MVGPKKIAVYSARTVFSMGTQNELKNLTKAAHEEN
jgi:hypothetical protein